MNLFFLGLLAGSLVSCVSWSTLPDQSQVARGSRGAVATAHPLASEAALQILKEGGNAMDAAVGASFVISVVKPQSTGIGGGGFLLFFDQRGAQTQAYDFRERAPSKATRNMFIDNDGKPMDFLYGGQEIPNASLNGHRAVAVPGLVAGIFEAHQRHGRLPWRRLLEPAIRIAQEGFLVYPSLVKAIKKRQAILSRFDSTSKVFLPGGAPLLVGDRLKQPDLAKTLSLIQTEGRDGFYRGPVADLIIKEMARGGGILTQKDLNTYHVKTTDPLESTYKGYKVISMPPPSSGGVHLIQILNILEQDDLKQMGYHSPEAIHLLVEAMKRAYADRAQYLGDPEFTKVPLGRLTSKSYAQKLRAGISQNRATPSASIRSLNHRSFESPSTTHISIVDQEGNAVSSTQTINYLFGSGVVAEGTGVILNDEMDDFSIAPGIPNQYGLVGGEANDIRARKTMLSSMTPTLVFSPGGQLQSVVGAAGGSRIITATLQTILGVIEFGLPLKEALHSPRMHHQWYPEVIEMEPGLLRPELEKSLEEKHHQVKMSQEPLAEVQGINREADAWVAVSDNRTEGRPMAW